MFFSSNRSFPFFRVFTIITKTKYLMLFYRRIWKISIGHICGIHAWILLKRKSLEKQAACMKNENHVDQDRHIVALHQCECLIKILRRHVRIDCVVFLPVFFLFYFRLSNQFTWHFEFHMHKQKLWTKKHNNLHITAEDTWGKKVKALVKTKKIQEKSTLPLYIETYWTIPA